MKKIVLWISVIISFSTISIANAEPQCGIIIDVNGDNKTGLEEAIYSLQVIAGIQGQCDNDESEPNNNFVDFTLIALGEQTFGKIDKTGDEDFFKFKTLNAGVIEISVDTVPTDIRLTATLYDSNQVKLESKESSTTGGKIIFNKLCDSGDYYFHLRGYISSYISDENYIFRIELDADDTFEINNNFANAKIISINKPVKGKIEDEGDQDYFKFTSAQTGNIEIVIDPVPFDINLTAKLYNSKQEHIITKNSSGVGGSIYLNATIDADDYYLSIEGSYSVSSSNEFYTLTIKQ